MLLLSAVAAVLAGQGSPPRASFVSPCPIAGKGPASYIDEHLIYFDPGSAEPPKTERTQAVLRSAVCWIRVGPSSVEVVGHADRTGAAEANTALSIHRSRAVAEALVALGVPSESIRVTGRGEAAPAVTTGDEVPEALNRRVAISIIRR